ncbi:Hypothetical protein SMAX5B_013707 [Scophthalmus maximus]|uniref:Uncharacterized protein n=1 Tax=Scophthalmus maximus TaxID=52904 RepID=A0A2U9AZW0_SCOMX|nr:Hypothetical protein SMAX5B_013707 [Scophthalmus maximus]
MMMFDVCERYEMKDRSKQQHVIYIRARPRNVKALGRDLKVEDVEDEVERRWGCGGTPGATPASHLHTAFT